MLLTHAVAERWVFGETSIPASQTARCRAIIQGDAAISQQRMALEASRRVDLPIDLGFLFCKRLYYRKILRDPARSRSERGRDIAATLIWGIRLKSGLRPQRGMIVTLSGPDGSGKTRHAETLVAALRQCEIRADYLWSRGGSTGIFRPASRLRRKLRGEGHDRAGATDDPIVRRRRRLENPLLRFGWAWLVAVDQLATYWLRAYLPARRGRVVITDRYLHDAVVELEASLPASARWSRMAARALLTCGPRPTLGYLLDLSATTARLRKPDEAWHIDWQRERERYRELAGLHGLRELSVEGSFEDSSDPLVHEVVMAFMARYETRLNGLFYSNPSQKNEPDPIWLGGGAR